MYNSSSVTLTADSNPIAKNQKEIQQDCTDKRRHQTLDYANVSDKPYDKIK